MWRLGLLLMLCAAVGCGGTPAAAPKAGSEAGGAATSAVGGEAPSGAASSRAPAASAPAASAANPYLAVPGEPLTPVRVATCAVTGGFVHIYTALEAGIFPKYGLDVQHTFIRGSGTSLAALSANEVQFVYCAVEATIPGLASGSEGRVVAAPLLGLPYVLISRPDVRSVPDLKGKSASIGRPGQLTDRLIRLILQRHNLRPNEDVDIRPVGGSQPEGYQSVISNVAQAAAVTPPLDAQARRDGLNVIYHMEDLGLPFVYSALHSNVETIRSQPRVVQRFVAALAEAVHFTEKQPEVTRQVLRKVLELEESDALDAAYEAYARKHVNRRLTIPIEALSEGIEFAREQGTQVTVRGGEDVATNQFAEDLERTGFLQALWGAELPAR